MSACSLISSFRSITPRTCEMRPCGCDNASREALARVAERLIESREPRARIATSAAGQVPPRLGRSALLPQERSATHASLLGSRSGSGDRLHHTVHHSVRLTYKARDGGLRRAWDWSVRCGADEMLRTTTTPPCEHIEALTPQRACLRATVERWACMYPHCPHVHAHLSTSLPSCFSLRMACG